MRIALQLPVPLSNDLLEQWHLAALRVLDQVGMEVPDLSLRDRLSACRGLRLRDKRVHFDPGVVSQLVDSVCKRGELPSLVPDTDRITIVAGAHAHHYLDPVSDELRPMSSADLVAATRLVDAMHDQGVIGSAPGIPQDVPLPVQGLAQMRIGCLYSRHGGACANMGSVKQARWVRRMAEAAGQSFGLGVHLTSPLRLAGTELEVALAFLEDDLPTAVTSMPMLGATAPQPVTAAAIQGLAESIGGFAALRLLGLTRVSFSFNLYSFDHAHASIVYGSPEQNLCDLVQVAVNRYYGAPRPTTRSIRSMSKRVDAQSCAERAASAVFGALLGSRAFAGGGLLSLDEVFSPLQLVLDREIADYAARIGRGIALDDPQACVGIIAEGAARGMYLDHETTVGRFREECGVPRFFTRELLAPWVHGGGRSAIDRAREATLELMAHETYQCPVEKAAAVEEVWRAACEELC